MGFNYWIMDIIDGEWVVEVDTSLMRILPIVHFGNLHHSYFEINVRNRKAGRLLI